MCNGKKARRQRDDRDRLALFDKKDQRGGPLLRVSILDFLRSTRDLSAVKSVNWSGYIYVQPSFDRMHRLCVALWIC